jgi:5-methylcytosine-specific restriction endonuclease McrA
VKRLLFVAYWLIMLFGLGWQLTLVFFIGWRLLRWSLRRKARRIHRGAPPVSIELPEGYDRIRDPISKKVKEVVLARDGWRCQNPACRTKAGPFHVDHIWPVNRGGTDRLVNLQTLCARCNLAKSDKVPHPSLVPAGEPWHYTEAELEAFRALENR